MPKINWTGFRIAFLFLVILIAIMLACPKVVSGQQVISAKSGLLHYFEGEVFVDGTAVRESKDRFVQLETGQVFSTKSGHAEILFGPGMFLRVGENCEINFQSLRSGDETISVSEDRKGCAMVLDFLDFPKNTEFLLDIGWWRFGVREKGVYHFSINDVGENFEFKVLTGRGYVEVAEAYVCKLPKGKSYFVKENTHGARKLDKKFSDEILRWSRKRSSYLAAANVWAAKNVFERFTEYRYRQNNFWYWNPYFGMYTFIPSRGNIDCYWGFRFFNPRGAADYYNWASSQNAYSGGSQPQNVQPAPSYGYRPDLGYSVGPRGSWSEISDSFSSTVPSQQSPRTSESASPREGSKGGRGR